MELLRGCVSRPGQCRHSRADDSVVWRIQFTPPFRKSIGTSYITLRGNTAQEICANSGGTVNTNIAPYVFRSMQGAPAVAVVTNIANGFRTTYTLPNWVVVEDVVIAGTTLADTNVRHQVTVTNTSAVVRSYGVR
jgi:hypothetical protein